MWCFDSNVTHSKILFTYTQTVLFFSKTAYYFSFKGNINSDKLTSFGIDKAREQIYILEQF
jgi:hypothetical protein